MIKLGGPRLGQRDQPSGDPRRHHGPNARRRGRRRPVEQARRARARARAAARVFPPRSCSITARFATREAFDAAPSWRLLRVRGAEWVVLAGFMRIVTPVLLDAYPMRVLNIHPALLPAFPGVDAQAQALAYGVRVTGCTVHFVDGGMDTGPIIAQTTIPVEDGDTVESLSARLLAEEHALLPATLQWFAEGRVTVDSADRGRAPGAQCAWRDPSASACAIRSV